MHTVENWKPSKNDRLCSKHFEPKYFYNVNDRIRLLQKTVPTIFERGPEFVKVNIKTERLVSHQNLVNDYINLLYIRFCYSLQNHL